MTRGPHVYFLVFKKTVAAALIMIKIIELSSFERLYGITIYIVASAFNDLYDSYQITLCVKGSAALCKASVSEMQALIKLCNLPQTQ